MAGYDMDTGGIEIGDDALALVGELVGELEASQEIGVDDLIAALDSDAFELGARPAGGGRLVAGKPKLPPKLASLVTAAKARKAESKRIAGKIKDKFEAAAVAVKPSVPIDSYAAVMNFRSAAAIAAGATATVFENAIESFKPEEVSLPVEIGPDFLIMSVDVGMRKLFASNAPLRASILQSTAFAKSMFNGITVQRGQPVTWIVQNTSGAVRFWEVTLFGKTVIMGGGMATGR